MRTPAWEPVDASVTVVGQSAPVLRLETNRNMLAINSYSTADTGVVAPLVDVGAGTAADYARQPVAGKIVLADGVGRRRVHRSRREARRARRAGVSNAGVHAA